MPAGPVTRTTASPHARVRAVTVGAVTLHDGFWHARTEANRMHGIPHLLERLEEHGVVENFRPGAERRGFWFTDSDLYKWMEAAAWSLGSHPDAALEGRLDALVATVCAAAEDDGYLDTNFPDPAARFAHLGWSHELYCAGHLIQAAVARHRVSADDRLLHAATRFADLIDVRLGPASDRTDTDLHPGIEAALVELARETGEERYLALAAALVDRVDLGTPVELRGHAVRAAYFATGIADLVLETDDPSRRESLDALWRSMVERKSYVTGGIGGRWIGESVGRDYELPGEGAYAETCGGVAVVHWAWRMLQLTGDAAYADRLELALHNALLAGVSLAGDEWFYANPLAASAAAEHDPWGNDLLPIEMAGPLPLARRPWREVTCCPPNTNRMLASLPGYLFGESDDGLWVHLYAPSAVTAAGMNLRVETGMPWTGDVTITVEGAPDREGTLRLRVPGWCERATCSEPATTTDGYLVIRRRFVAGDAISLALEVAPTVVGGHPRVAETRGAVALVRGPLVYCLESLDNPGVDVLAAALDPTAALTAEPRPDLLGGVTVLHASGSVPATDGAPLYRPVGTPTIDRDVTLTAIPYFAWANRGPSAMSVWLGRA